MTAPDGMAGLSYTFTVFTPTYNRAHTLHRVYESLAGQTFRDFEWLIVDDGSTDETSVLVANWQRESSFAIRYLYQPNRGEHHAMNRGALEARGRLFLPLDSDDACVPHALERFIYHWYSIPPSRREAFSAVTALGSDVDGVLVGTKFPEPIFDSNSIEIVYRHKVTGDKWGFHCTDVLRRFPFPDVEGESFVTEAIVWQAIARHFQTRFVNELLLRIHRPADGSRGTSLSMVSVANRAEGMRRYCLSVLNNDLKWLPQAPYQFLTTGVNYVRYSLHKCLDHRQQWGALDGIAPRLLWLACLPLGHALYWRDRRRRATCGD